MYLSLRFTRQSAPLFSSVEFQTKMPTTMLPGLVDDAVDTMSDLDLAEHIAYLRKERGGNSAGMALSDSYFTKRYAKEDVEDAKCAMLKADRLTRRLRSEAQAGRPGPTGRRV